jgi:carbon monoxide dehydrogenase subunit G
LKLEGSAQVALEPAAVFDQLLDPKVLARCIPGCERMEKNEDGAYETLVSAGIGAVKGSFKGVVTLSDVVAPERYRLSISGKSPVGYIDGGALISLEPADDGTTIRYDGEAKVSGKIAAVGGRLIDAAARTLVRNFFDRLAVEVART